MWVLTYHSVSEGPAPLCLRPDDVAEQLDTLLELGWRAVPLDHAVRLAESQDPEDPGAAPCFAVSFDDAYCDFASEALPLLEARAIPSTLFAVADEGAAGAQPTSLYDAPRLGPSQLRELHTRGVQIGAHGTTHCDLRQLDDESLAAELRNARERLESAIDAPVDTLAYPLGAFDRRVCRAAERHYRAAFTTQLSGLPVGAHPIALPRVDAYYLNGALLRRALQLGVADTLLFARRQLRRLRGTEPRISIPTQDPGKREATPRAGLPTQGRHRSWP